MVLRFVQNHSYILLPYLLRLQYPSYMLAITTIIFWSKFPPGYNLINLNLSYSRTSHLWCPINLSTASFSAMAIDRMSRTELIVSIFDLSNSEPGAINNSEIFPDQSITNAARYFHRPLQDAELSLMTFS